MQQQQNTAVLPSPLIGYGVTKAEAAKIREAAETSNNPARSRGGLFASVRKAFR